MLLKLNKKVKMIWCFPRNAVDPDTLLRHVSDWRRAWGASCSPARCHLCTGSMENHHPGGRAPVLSHFTWTSSFDALPHLPLYKSLLETHRDQTVALMQALPEEPAGVNEKFMEQFMQWVIWFNGELYFIYIILYSGVRKNTTLCKILQEFLWDLRTSYSDSFITQERS